MEQERGWGPTDARAVDTSAIQDHEEDHIQRAIADDRGLIVSWLLKLLVTLAIVGALLLEGGAVLINHLQASDVASRAATEAGLVYANRGDTRAAEARAVEITEREGAEFVSFNVNRERNETSVTVERSARTQFIHRWEPLERFATVETTETAPIRQ